MRPFQPSGIRRLNGFQAVTKAAERARCRRSSASKARLRAPMRTAMPPAS
jgi:hypothetical protein